MSRPKSHSAHPSAAAAIPPIPSAQPFLRSSPTQEKSRLLTLIRTLAAQHPARPLSQRQFSRLTGLPLTSWRGRLFTRWSDALHAAGLTPQSVPPATPPEHLWAKIADLSRQLQRIPTDPDLRLARRNDPTFPSLTTILRLGSWRDRVTQLSIFCECTPAYTDLHPLWSAALHQPTPTGRPPILRSNLPQHRAHQLLVSHLNQAAPPPDPTQLPGALGCLELWKNAAGLYKLLRLDALTPDRESLSTWHSGSTTLVHRLLTRAPLACEIFWSRQLRIYLTDSGWYQLPTHELTTFALWTDA